MKLQLFITLFAFIALALAKEEVEQTIAQDRHDKGVGDLKSLSKFPWGLYPIWKIHKYKGVSLKPVPIGILPPPPPPAYYPPAPMAYPAPAAYDTYKPTYMPSVPVAPMKGYKSLPTAPLSFASAPSVSSYGQAPSVPSFPALGASLPTGLPVNTQALSQAAGAASVVPSGLPTNAQVALTSSASSYDQASASQSVPSLEQLAAANGASGAVQVPSAGNSYDQPSYSAPAQAQSYGPPPAPAMPSYEPAQPVQSYEEAPPSYSAPAAAAVAPSAFASFPQAPSTQALSQFAGQDAFAFPSSAPSAPASAYPAPGMNYGGSPMFQAPMYAPQYPPAPASYAAPPSYAPASQFPSQPPYGMAHEAMSMQMSNGGFNMVVPDGAPTMASFAGFGGAPMPASSQDMYAAASQPSWSQQSAYDQSQDGNQGKAYGMSSAEQSAPASSYGPPSTSNGGSFSLPPSDSYKEQANYDQPSSVSAY